LLGIKAISVLILFLPHKPQDKFLQTMTTKNKKMIADLIAKFCVNSCP
jgi:hypothetical protein